MEKMLTSSAARDFLKTWQLHFWRIHDYFQDARCFNFLCMSFTCFKIKL